MRSQALPQTDFRNPGQVLTALNDAFQMEKQNNLYFTIWYGVFNKATRELKYATAGHPPALLVRQDREITELITPSMFIGGMEGIKYTSGTIGVDFPARLYVFSDGVYEVERQDGSIWGLGGLKGFIAEHNESASEIETLYGFLRDVRGQEYLEDDFSMLKIEFLE